MFIVFVLRVNIFLTQIMPSSELPNNIELDYTARNFRLMQYNYCRAADVCAVLQYNIMRHN